MTSASAVRGSLSEVILNKNRWYEGDLVQYFCAIFRARNVHNPYHNFRHTTHVTWLCHHAGGFYSIEPRPMRNFLIAAMFHDYDHAGRSGDDDLNVARAIRGLEKHVLETDRPFLDDIVTMIRATEYPYTIRSEDLDLRAKILRDADLGQALNPAWLQQVVFGLAVERGERPIETLRLQKTFLSSFKPLTEWGRTMFPQEVIKAKIAEAAELLGILESCEGVSV
jgi:hypothetical protein